jgi:hypothetical protein
MAGSISLQFYAHTPNLAETKKYIYIYLCVRVGGCLCGLKFCMQRYLEAIDQQQRDHFVREAIQTIANLGPSAVSAIVELLSSFVVMVCECSDF